ncbi:MAG: DUF4118 domain-containing protein [Eubacterium sp.]|nr:DUF4118 domain-containing protein [Eubacterium sp.]MDY5498414.1 DUF4118 domain-containing protein [Anaerobutyricum sp.]
MCKKKGREKLYYNVFCLAMVFLIATAVTAVSVGLGRMGFRKENLLMIFLVGVLLTTVVTSGYWYGFLDAILSVFLFNFFFTEPFHTLLIGNRQDFFLLFFFFAASAISGLLSSKLKRQKEIADENSAVTGRLYEITEGFLKLTGMNHIIESSLEYLYECAGVPCKMVLNKEFREIFSDCSSLAAVYYMPGDGCKLLPEDFGRGIVVRGISREMGKVFFKKGTCFDENTEKIINAIIYQTALVFDRESIYAEREKIRLAMESEHLKSTLLRSISHDLRTPLTGIIGSANLLENYFEPDKGRQMEQVSREDAGQLVDNIIEEASWLNMTVKNILNMTRISDGKLTLHTEYESVDDLLNETAERLPAVYDKKRLTIQEPEEICLVKVDGSLFVQVLLNLIDNAYKYAGEDAEILLCARENGSQIIFQVKDNGPGIDGEVMEHIFDGFVTGFAHSVDKGRGVGLGLTICKAIVEAHGGRIRAWNNRDGGACFEISLPDCDEACENLIQEEQG